MKQILSIIVASTVLLIATRRPPADAAAVARTVSYNPGPAVAQDCQTHSFTAFANISTSTVHLAALDMWIGLYRGAYADLTIEVYRVSVNKDPLFVSSFRQDRYTEPGGVHQRFVEIPGGVDIAPGQRLQVNTLNCYVAGVSSPMHPIVDLYFTGQE